MAREIKTKEVNWKEVYYCAYCELSELLRSADYYNAGSYGWNWDGFIIEDKLIITGYRNLKGKRIPIETCKKYNDLAKEVVNSATNWDEKSEKLNELKSKLINELEGSKAL